MQRVVIDTNVFVSSLIQRGHPRRIVYDLFWENKIELCVSSSVMKEYYEVLNRKRFLKYLDFRINADRLLGYIETKGLRYSPKLKVNLISDENDFLN